MFCLKTAPSKHHQKESGMRLQLNRKIDFVFVSHSTQANLSWLMQDSCDTRLLNSPSKYDKPLNMENLVTEISTVSVFKNYFLNFLGKRVMLRAVSNCVYVYVRVWLLSLLEDILACNVWDLQMPYILQSTRILLKNCLAQMPTVLLAKHWTTHTTDKHAG